jgi:alkanesulfonate monooxygenase SsuD/methylene tetrahydromethanopterin reductase-like flavin-dependent oxidoreductase (luciferase family)
MIGGGGEKKTLRLVAQYADATNVFGGPDMLRRKYAILQDHCEAVGRPFEEIERTTLQSTRLSDDGRDRTETPEAVADRFGALAAAGAQHVIVGIQNVEQPGVDALAARLVELVHGI